jgi:putative endonuclease
MSYFVYILRTSGNTLYTGQTNNLDKRICEHQSKSPKGAKYTKYFKTVKLVYSEEYPTRSEAMKREAEIKKLSRVKKEIIISSQTNREESVSPNQEEA